MNALDVGGEEGPVGREKHPRHDEVIAWVRETGNGYRAAAEAFDLATSTVRDWIRRARKAGDLPPAAKGRTKGKRSPKRPKPAAPSLSVVQGGRKREGGNQSHTEPPPVPTRARGALKAANLSTKTRAHLSRAMLIRLQYLSGDASLDPPEIADSDTASEAWRKIQAANGQRALNAARTLAILVELAPDALDFIAPEGDGKDVDDIAALRRAAGLPPASES